jgi:UDP-GlcNAc:undecaprenyl-phosphate GlcNAc-1-phosphate transferase
LDAAYALLRRWAQNESIFRADRGHLHHRLLDVGFSQRSATLLLCGLSALGAVAGVQVAHGHHVYSWAGALLLATLPLVRILRLRPTRWVSDAARGPVAESAGPLPNGTVSHERAA